MLIKQKRKCFQHGNKKVQKNVAEDYFQESVVSSSRIIGHELTHQWTGNYVTCSWWDEIWINEAFANLGGYFGMRYSDPDWIWENIFIQVGFKNRSWNIYLCLVHIQNQ